MPTKAKAAPPKFYAWSWSRFSDHRRCGFYAKMKHLDKLPEPQGPAMERGQRIHKLAEDYTLGTLKVLPDELKLFKDEFAHLRKVKANVEGQLAVNRSWKKEVWFSKEAWLRSITDARYEENRGKTVVAIDHKTGKIYDENDEQLSLYVPVLFAHYPDAEEIILELWYIDQGEERRYRYHRAGIAKPKTLKPEAKGRGEIVEKGPSNEALMKAWTEKSYPIMTDRKFSPTPNDKCRFCHFRKSNGGPCKF